ncbi:TetR/AcrR family transcriptional regulator [Pseudomonas sp. CCC3.2]|uniref:TetR/AcrR family transcriptional regulator n=1 Tax=unclassified Pseudomonas TaxID=196821 RepID=UPI002AB4D52E|nr:MULTISPECIES: TetR/AcrR family transcriptional regulator [unclassified Pseudomonas]MDY7559849.1 TetR/AcrR family transcriptional regulator [Pseudomonas sp. AB6]MEA9977863.1 TetR/AcrR family transcriptional regulator [Pseudomonas sp. RTS4]MEB0179512.1 TetR/AcrR family transcriptional regulator [Pseudomonas sp. CCC3.2]MEB0195878.1 TetR/AcrR family transcriptional regulator [Pseudomonas sp. 5S4]MEB0210578.1 TetR/AcrR family transcriptional regulator [Pseudomonas sp. AB6]
MQAKSGSSATRQRLLTTASELFLRDGINATGIAAIAAHAGVTKMTLYAYFSSKDELIVAFLEQRNERWNTAVGSTLAGIAHPAEKLLSLFDLYRDWLVKGGLRGCAYVNCSAEFPDRSHPVRLAVARHKQSVRSHLKMLAESAGLINAEVIAQRLFLLLEGAFLTGALENDDRVFFIARELADELINAALVGRLSLN